MAYAFPGAGALDYSPCSYAGSRILFRGPKADLREPFVACLGGTETFIHAYTGHGVVESPLSAPWARRIVARFAFPVSE